MGLPRLIGMVHAGALPGAPAFAGDIDEVVDRAVMDAQTLADAGFDGLMIENFGDAPFHADDVPKVTIAALTALVGSVAARVDLPVGVNVLRNDAIGALAIAAATGASFIRVNVLSGTMFTDQGPIVGRAAEVARERAAICPDVAIMADVFVKHATPPAGLDLADATHDLAERSGADAVIVSGSGTGAETSIADLRTVAGASPLPVFVGSGVDLDNIAAMLGVADGVIVGTSVKLGGRPDQPVDPQAAARIVQAAP